MTVLNLADALRVGSSVVDKAYHGADLVFGGSPSYADEVLADSPLGYWRLGEAAGTTMVDSSGNGRDGTYSGPTLGATGLLTGDADTAATFDGTNDYGSVPYAAWMATGAALTAEGWFTPNRLTGHNMIVGHVDYSLSVNSTRYSFHLRWSGAKLHVGIGSTNANYSEWTGGPDLVVGQTYHAVMSWDGTTVRVYLNGAEIFTGAKSGTLWDGSAKNLTVGNDASLSVAPAGGVIDEVAVYASALSAARIAAHYQAGVSPYVAEVSKDSPLAYYRLGESSGTTMVDSSGNGRNGTYSGAVTLAAPGLLTGDGDTAADFAGGKAVTPHGAWLDGPDFTVEAWIKPDTGGTDTLIAGRWHTSDTTGYIGLSWSLFLTADRRLRLILATGTYSAVDLYGTTVLDLGVTHHVAASFFNWNSRLYLNGVVDGSNTNTVQAYKTSGSAFAIGGAQAFGQDGNRFDGVIDEVALYGAALSAERILAHYNAGIAA